MNLARVTLPIPKMPHSFPVHLPRPSPLPVLPTEADLARAEKRLEQTELHEQQTMRPGVRQNRQNIQRTIRKVEQAIESGHLGERDLYDAIVNLHLLKHTLEKNAAVRAFENALLVQKIVARYLRA